jgi:folate-dependent phosphoribosylglycinamide formyltransferase PurN
MKTVLICHETDNIDREITAGWLASFSDLVGVIVLREKRQRMKKRVKREIQRVGYGRFLDVLAFRFYYKFFLAAKDEKWRRETIDRFKSIYPASKDVRTLITHSPNSAEAENFLKEAAADIIVARCKTLLKKNIFTLAKTGTVVFHPGVCPEYRNAHGCFWALAREDYKKVGMTLLQIDEGVDTGPTFGYYSYDYNALTESHIVIQTRVVTENLPELQVKLEEIYAGKAQPLDVTGRESNVWGQPWLTEYFKVKRKAKDLVKTELQTRDDPKSI